MPNVQFFGKFANKVTFSCGCRGYPPLVLAGASRARGAGAEQLQQHFGTNLQGVGLLVSVSDRGPSVENCPPPSTGGNRQFIFVPRGNLYVGYQ